MSAAELKKQEGKVKTNIQMSAAIKAKLEEAWATLIVKQRTMELE